MTLVGFEPGTPEWQANVLTNRPKISRYYLVTKSQYLNLVQKVGTFLISAYPIVDSDRACSELPRTVFRSYGISKWPRLDSRQMWASKEWASRNRSVTCLCLHIPLVKSSNWGMDQFDEFQLHLEKW